jgi:membrane peptidoglycan carboxypeptidase
MARCESDSGGSSSTKDALLVIDQSAGAVKVAPVGVVRGVSFASRSEADLAGAGSTIKIAAATAAKFKQRKAPNNRSMVHLSLIP